MNPSDLFNYQVFIFLMMVGFYTIISRPNLVKKLLGLTIFQTAVFIFYISLGKIRGGTAPILLGDYAESTEPVLYSNPIPHVLILTAIVVGVATLSVGLALVVRIKEEYGTIESDEIIKMEAEA